MTQIKITFLTGAFGRPFLFAAPLKLIRMASSIFNVVLIGWYLASAEATEESNRRFVQTALIYSAILFLNSMFGKFMGMWQ